MKKPIELSGNLLNQVSGGCHHKCACEKTLEEAKKIPNEISDAVKKIPDQISDAVPERVKEVPGKVNKFIHDL